MENEKRFATVEFDDGQSFEVDFRNMRLIDMDNPKNIIHLNDMRDTGTGYEFYYDPQTKNITQVPEGFVEKDTGPYLVRINYLTVMHPYAMSRAHNVPIELVNGKTDKEFLDFKLRREMQQVAQIRKYPYKRERKGRKSLGK